MYICILLCTLQNTERCLGIIQNVMAGARSENSHHVGSAHKPQEVHYALFKNLNIKIPKTGEGGFRRGH